MGKHAAPDGFDGTGGELIGEYHPVAIPDNPQCCTPEQLADKVEQIDNAYEKK